MTQAEENQYRQRIEMASNADEWYAIDRELRARGDVNQKWTQDLLRQIERRCAPLVGNTVFRVMAQDLENPEIPQPVETEDPLRDTILGSPGRVMDFKIRLREKGQPGITFTLSDMMQDPDMAIAIRETEAYFEDLLRLREDFVSASSLEGSEEYRQVCRRLDAVWDKERLQAEFADILENDLPALSAEEITAVTSRFTWRFQGEERWAKWSANGEVTQHMLDLEEAIGTSRLAEYVAAIEAGDLEASRQLQYEMRMAARDLAALRPDNPAGGNQRRGRMI